MRVALVSHSDGRGGAARAATRLLESLPAAGVDATMVVDVAVTGRSDVIGPRNHLERLGAALRPYADAAVLKAHSPHGFGHRSVAVLPGGGRARVLALQPEVVNLHWSGTMLSISQIGRLPHPLVWSLHDMWPFCGVEHVVDGAAATHWRAGVAGRRLAGNPRRWDVDQWTRARKVRHWNEARTLVTPSRWLACRASESALLHGWPIEVIPNALPVDRYLPTDRRLARTLLGLPPDVPLLLFAALGGTSSPGKGWDSLLSAAEAAQRTSPDLQVVVLGEHRPAGKRRLPVPVHWLGVLQDDVSMSLAYSAVDVTVVPSRLESLSQVATESLASGTPVVAFQVGGLPDVVDHGSTGYLAPAGDIAGLAEGISRLLTRDDDESIRRACRSVAVDRWAPHVVAGRYRTLFERVLEGKERTCG